MVMNTRTPKFQRALALAAGWGLLLTACAPAPTATPSPAAPSDQPVPAASPTTAADVSATAEPATDPAAGGLLRLVLAPDGNEARFRVREQLAGLAFPSDAVGATSAIEGALVLTPDGGSLSVVSDQSSFVVDLTTLRSDSSMRDNFIRRNTLETDRFPTAEFIPTEAVGLPSLLPTSGEVNFQLVGQLTVHGVTREATWDVTAQIVDDKTLAGTASTSFTFGEHGMTIPRVARVLSIEDHIQLEYDFRLVLES